MDYFLPAKQPIPESPSASHISFFALYDPSTEPDPTVLSSWPLECDDDTRLRRIGLIRGMNSFVSGFGDERLEYVELDDQWFVVNTFEERFEVVLGVRLKKLEDGTTSSVDLAPLGYLRSLLSRGYDDFRLHNGTIESLCGSMAAEEVAMFMQKWWSVWLDNVPLQMDEDGLLKLFRSVRRSKLKVDSDIHAKVNLLREKHGFREFLVWNTHAVNYENHGLVYEHVKSMSEGSKIRLLNWIQETSHYSLTPNSLSQPVVLKSKEVNEDDNSREQIYDPFKLVWTTLGDVSNATGLTSSVDAGIKTINEGVNLVGAGAKMVTSYVPFWGSTARSSSRGSVSQGSLGSAEHDSEEAPAIEDVQFLIGRVGDNVVYKNVYLEFDGGEERLHRLVIFKYYSYVILLVYDFNVNTLNELTYYDELYQDLNKLGKHHFPSLIEDSKSFYYMAFDRLHHKLESNMPNIPHDTPEADDVTSSHDLNKNRVHALMIQREVLQSMSFTGVDDVHEKLIRTANGWWVYNNRSDPRHEILIVKKWKFTHGHSILESSANIMATIGSDAQEWLDDYLSRSG